MAMVAADTVYGVGELEMALRRAGGGYVLGVSATYQFHSWSAKLSVSGTAEEIAEGLDASAWQRLSASPGTKGPRLYDWAYLELATLDAAAPYPGSSGLWTRGLLVRRSLADGKLAYFTTWCPAGTAAAKRVEVEGCRWAIEDSFETARTELGLDHNETRSWHGWHRHISLVMLAFAMMATIRHQANQPAPPKTTAAPAPDPITSDPDTPNLDTPALVRWSVQELRRFATRLAQRRIQPAHVIAWSLWRRAHQAAAQHSHLRRKQQL